MLNPSDVGPEPLEEFEQPLLLDEENGEIQNFELNDKGEMVPIGMNELD